MRGRCHVTYETVVVGSDGSATAELAVRTAVEVAVEHGARLVIVTAYKAQGDEMARQSAVPEDIRWAVTDVNQAEDRVREARQLAAAAGLSGTVTRAEAGSAVDVILDAATTFSADLIVLGSKGLTPGTHSVLGSVAASVAHHAPCDVMIIQTTD
jgi:nucleotide-binding universal stress UspA family protein